MRITCENQHYQVSESPESYPMHEHIISIKPAEASSCCLVTWMFPNHEIVQLIFYSEESAELFSVSSHLVLANEVEDGNFYTRSEIELFLSGVKRYRA